MGGSGSGRNGSTKDTTGEYLRVDVRFMEREGFLLEHSSGSLYWSSFGKRIGTIGFRTEADRVMLSYKHRDRVGVGEYEVLEYAVRLERTPCHFGGSRAWFLCPARGCGRRTATLYGGRIYACRKCYELAYESQRGSRSDQAAGRAERILKRLQCDDILTIFDADPPRPKGMHLRTYRRLAVEYEHARYQSFLFGPPGAMAHYERPDPNYSGD